MVLNTTPPSAPEWAGPLGLCTDQQACNKLPQTGSQHTLTISQFLWVRALGTDHGVLRSGSHKAAVKALSFPEPEVLSELAVAVGRVSSLLLWD